MTAKFGYVTTACRLCEDIVPPDGGDLRCGAIDGPVGTSLQPVLAYVRQRVPQRHRHGPLRWKRPSESHHQHARRQSRTAHSLARTGHVPLLQPFSTCRQTFVPIPSGETTQLPIQGRVCGRLQHISPCEERRPIHRVQPAGCPVATSEESPLRARTQVLRVHEGEPRLRHKQAQQHGSGGSAKTSAA
ncbi:unnamed protein product [Parnassius mnemosyne]|uniref:Uncharacterized protein n=1 Tax=Parnassius mnemosyne TaxID=213953 RepID=A0AAV1KQG9_9NEOP